MLRNYLHAPDCPINLISVGTLNDTRMTVNFAPDSVTTLTFPDDPKKLGHLAGKSFMPDHCIPCLIGKSPQVSYSSNKHRATDICELVHVDTCGPYPVLMRKKKRYFLAILDDYSNYGACPLLVLKNGACIAWRKTKARWENLLGNKVKAIRVDNAKEFVEGKMREDLDDAGIAIQATAPYAHQQNGKIFHPPT